MNSKLSQEHEEEFQVGDLVCYKKSLGSRLYGIITETKKEMIKVYWRLDKEEVSISPLSFPPMRRNGWIAAGILREAGSLKIVSKKT
jgi:hypothetical protein